MTTDSDFLRQVRIFSARLIIPAVGVFLPVSSSGWDFICSHKMNPVWITSPVLLPHLVSSVPL